MLRSTALILESLNTTAADLNEVSFVLRSTEFANRMGK
jgi:hypothetical protein